VYRKPSATSGTLIVPVLSLRTACKSTWSVASGGNLHSLRLNAAEDVAFVIICRSPLSNAGRRIIRTKLALTV